MIANLLTLPRELRDVIYEHVLLIPELVRPMQMPLCQVLSLGLCRVNRMFHREAGQMFYSRSRFDLGKYPPSLISSFLQEIGNRNTGYIRHIRMNLPELYLTPAFDRFELDRDDVSLAAVLRRLCTSLETLTFIVHNDSRWLLDFDDEFRERMPKDMFKIIDDCFRSMTTLRDSIVDISENDLQWWIEDEAERFGWKIEMRDDISIGSTEVSDSASWLSYSEHDSGNDFDNDGDP